MVLKTNKTIYEDEINEIKKICDEMESQLGPEGEYFSDKIRTSLKGLKIAEKYADIDDDIKYQITYDAWTGVETEYVTGKKAVYEFLSDIGEDAGYTVFQNVTEEF